LLVLGAVPICDAVSWGLDGSAGRISVQIYQTLLSTWQDHREAGRLLRPSGPILRSDLAESIQYPDNRWAVLSVHQPILCKSSAGT